MKDDIKGLVELAIYIGVALFLIILKIGFIIGIVYLILLLIKHVFC